MHVPEAAINAGLSQPASPPLRPAFISVAEAAHYLGVARSTLYKDFLPGLETVRVGKRNLVLLESLDRLVEQLRAGRR